MIETIISIRKYIYNIYIYSNALIDLKPGDVYMYKLLVKESVRISEYKSKISKTLQHSRGVSKNYTIVLPGC